MFWYKVQLIEANKLDVESSREPEERRSQLEVEMDTSMDEELERVEEEEDEANSDDDQEERPTANIMNNENVARRANKENCGIPFATEFSTSNLPNLQDLNDPSFPFFTCQSNRGTFAYMVKICSPEKLAGPKTGKHYAGY